MCIYIYSIQISQLRVFNSSSSIAKNHWFHTADRLPPDCPILPWPPIGRVDWNGCCWLQRSDLHDAHPWVETSCESYTFQNKKQLRGVKLNVCLLKMKACSGVSHHHFAPAIWIWETVGNVLGKENSYKNLRVIPVSTFITFTCREKKKLLEKGSSFWAHLRYKPHPLSPCNPPTWISLNAGLPSQIPNLPGTESAQKKKPLHTYGYLHDSGCQTFSSWLAVFPNGKAANGGFSIAMSAIRD